MNTKEMIGKAIVDVDEGKPLEFKKKIEEVTAAKMKSAIDKAVANAEKSIFTKK